MEKCRICHEELASDSGCCSRCQAEFEEATQSTPLPLDIEREVDHHDPEEGLAKEILKIQTLGDKNLEHAGKAFNKSGKIGFWFGTLGVFLGGVLENIVNSTSTRWNERETWGFLSLLFFAPFVGLCLAAVFGWVECIIKLNYRSFSRESERMEKALSDQFQKRKKEYADRNEEFLPSDYTPHSVRQQSNEDPPNRDNSTPLPPVDGIRKRDDI
jgi:hypothetical protein